MRPLYRERGSGMGRTALLYRRRGRRRMAPLRRGRMISPYPIARPQAPSAVNCERGGAASAKVLATKKQLKGKGKNSVAALKCTP
eukprot:scaffold77999_cov17-Tisochrysis_lutea.AAC.1